MNEIKLLWQTKYVGLFIILFCACFGSIRGAFKESGEPFIGVTKEDLAIMEEYSDGGLFAVVSLPLFCNTS